MNTNEQEEVKELLKQIGEKYNVAILAVDMIGKSPRMIKAEFKKIVNKMIG